MKETPIQENEIKALKLVLSLSKPFTNDQLKALLEEHDINFDKAKLSKLKQVILRATSQQIERIFNCESSIIKIYNEINNMNNNRGITESLLEYFLHTFDMIPETRSPKSQNEYFQRLNYIIRLSMTFYIENKLDSSFIKKLQSKLNSIFRDSPDVFDDSFVHNGNKANPYLITEGVEEFLYIIKNGDNYYLVFHENGLKDLYK